jgi:hypothetical protein
MNREERASYFVGQAILRQLRDAPRDPETVREIGAVCRWIEYWLTADEYVHVATTTGYDFAGYLAGDESVAPSKSAPGSSSADGTPF